MVNRAVVGGNQISICVLISFGEMLIKHAQIQLDWHLEFRHVLNQFSLQEQLLDALMVRILLLNLKQMDIWIKFFKEDFVFHFYVFVHSLHRLKSDFM